MGIFRRLALIMKGYVSATGDRLDKIAAEEELRETRSRQKAAKELESATATDRFRARTDATGHVVVADAAPRLANEYRLLGLKPGAQLEAVEAAWRELARRADPKRFPSGSPEERKAAEILNAVNDAYASIRESLNPTEGRFGRLEL